MKALSLPRTYSWRREPLRNVVEEGRGHYSEPDDIQSGNATKISDITGADGIPKLQCASSDDEIRERQIVPFSCLLATDTRDDLGRCFRNRMDGTVAFSSSRNFLRRLRVSGVSAR